MIVYPTWPCSYQEERPDSQKAFSYDKMLEKIVSLENVHLTASEIKEFIESFNSKHNQLSLFDQILEEESTVVPEDSNPFLDMYQCLCELKVPISQSSRVEGKALVHKDIFDSYYPNGIDLPIDINLFEKKFNIPNGKIISLQISKKIVDDYYEIIMEKIVDTDQIIF